MSINVVKCSWLKCNEVLQCSDGLRNKASNIIRRHIDNMQLLLICILLLSHSFVFFRFSFLSIYSYIWLSQPASCTMGTGSFPGVKYGRGVLLTIHPLLVPRSLKGRAIPLPTLWATTGPITGTLYLCSVYGCIPV